jgi:hypothetical protein
LSQAKCIDRALQLWDDLVSYFKSKFEDDDEASSSKSKSPRMKSGKKLADREQRMVNAFNDPMTNAYVLFLQSVMPVFTEFTVVLEKNEPMIHALRPIMMKLFKSILQRLVTIQAIAATWEMGLECVCVIYAIIVNVIPL